MRQNNMRNASQEKRSSQLRSSQSKKPADGNYTPGEYQAEAMAFMKSCLGEEQYARIMSPEKARQHPYVAARLFLSPQDWKKYVYVEQHGTLEGFT